MHASDKQFPKWRPIQAFIALTDTISKSQGGFECAKGFHKDFAAWSQSRPASTAKGITSPPPCVGDFTPIRSVEDKDVMERFEHVACRAGDLVLWDYRIPHANALKNESESPREVVYIGVLPRVSINESYCREQLRMFEEGRVPTDQWHEHTGLQPCSYTFSSLGKEMMMIT